MRTLVFVLAVLAIAKISYHQYLFRRTTSEVIVAAYRDRAVSACQKDAKSQSLPGTAWAAPDTVTLVIGKSNLNVSIWQVDNALWSARFTNPYLFLKAAERPNVYCEFDIVHGAATVFRM